MRKPEMITFHLGMGVGIALGVGALAIHKNLVLVVVLLVVLPPVVHMWMTMRTKEDEIDHGNPHNSWYK